MDRPTEQPDPNALTQPIPVVPTAPPRRPSSGSSGGDGSLEPTRPSSVAERIGPASLTPIVANDGSSAPYVHRFGNLSTYLIARFLAFAIDIFGVAFVLATFGYHLTDVGTIHVAGHDPAGYATLVGLSLGLALIFAFLCEALFGTTLGKLVFALHTRRGNGRHAGAVRVFVRYLIRPIDLLVIGPLLALVTPRHQRIGDFLSGTVVARSSIGAFASVLGVLAIAAAIYAQVVFGGGLTSAIGVTAETADYGPGLVARTTSLFGVPGGASQNLTPQTASTDAPLVTPAPIESSKIN